MFQKIAKHRANDASNDVHRPPLLPGTTWADLLRSFPLFCSSGDSTTLAPRCPTMGWDHFTYIDGEYLSSLRAMCIQLFKGGLSATIHCSFLAAFKQFYTYYCQAFWQHSNDLREGRILLTVISFFNGRHWLLLEDFLKVLDQLLFSWTLCLSSALENRDITGGWRRPICPGGWQVLIVYFLTQRTATFRKPIDAMFKPSH